MFYFVKHLMSLLHITLYVSFSLCKNNTMSVVFQCHTLRSFPLLRREYSVSFTDKMHSQWCLIPPLILMELMQHFFHHLIIQILHMYFCFLQYHIVIQELYQGFVLKALIIYWLWQCDIIYLLSSTAPQKQSWGTIPGSPSGRPQKAWSQSRSLSDSKYWHFTE